LADRNDSDQLYNILGRQNIGTSAAERPKIKGKLSVRRQVHSLENTYGRPTYLRAGADAGAQTHRPGAVRRHQLVGSSCASPVACSPRLSRPDRRSYSNPAAFRLQKSQDKNKSQIDLSDGTSNQSHYHKASLLKQQRAKDRIGGRKESESLTQALRKVQGHKIDWESREEDMGGYSQ